MKVKFGYVEGETSVTATLAAGVTARCMFVVVFLNFN